MYKKLVEDNMKLVRYVIKYKIPYIPSDIRRDIEDLYQEGYIFLIRAAKNYNESKGYAFSTYAVKCVYLGLVKLISKHVDKRNYFKKVSLNECFYDDFKNKPILVEDILADEQDDFKLADINQCVIKTQLKDIEKIIRLRCEGYTIDEVAIKLGLSRSTVKNRVMDLRKIIKL